MGGESAGWVGVGDAASGGVVTITTAARGPSMMIMVMMMAMVVVVKIRPPFSFFDVDVDVDGAVPFGRMATGCGGGGRGVYVSELSLEVGIVRK